MSDRRRYGKLTPAQITKAVALYRHGVTTKNIAIRFGVASGTVISALRKAGVTIDRHQEWPSLGSSGAGRRERTRIGSE